MARNTVIARVAILTFVLFTSSAYAAPCRVAKGHFVKCGSSIPAARTTAVKPKVVLKPAPAATALPGTKCRDAKGHFIRCATARTQGNWTPFPRKSTSAPPSQAPVSRPTQSYGSQATNPGGPNGATAHCVDGSYSHSAHRSGTCSGHGGVAVWY